MNTSSLVVATSRPANVQLNFWRRLPRVAGVTMLAIAVAALSAAQPVTPPVGPPPTPGPTVNLNEPVTVKVTGPVEVQGAVEIVNDALKTPYHRMAAIDIKSDVPDGLSIFPVPAGKRLVIETVTVYATVPAGQSAYASLSFNSTVVALAVQPQGTVGTTTRYIGTHPVTIRLNASLTSDILCIVARSAANGTALGAAGFQVSVFGYTEDI